MAELQLGFLLDPETGERGAEPFALDSADLTTHGVIVGMTGSGKTGLGIVLLEEALAAGIPALVLDPKGDMGNLLLAFPELAPADFRPWVNEDDARRAGLTADEYAAQVAAEWRAGLESQGLGPERIAAFRAAADLAVYTPGSQAGGRSPSSSRRSTPNGQRTQPRSRRSRSARRRATCASPRSRSSGCRRTDGTTRERT